MYLTGPAVGGLFIARFGAAPSMAVDGITYALCAALIAAIPAAAGRVAAGVRSAPYRSSLGSGWHVLLGHADLATLTFLRATAGATDMVFGVLMIPLVTQVLHGGPGAVGLLEASLSGGVILGADRALASHRLRELCDDALDAGSEPALAEALLAAVHLHYTLRRRWRPKMKNVPADLAGWDPAGAVLLDAYATDAVGRGAPPFCSPRTGRGGRAGRRELGGADRACLIWGAPTRARLPPSQLIASRWPARPSAAVASPQEPACSCRNGAPGGDARVKRGSGGLPGRRLPDGHRWLRR